MKNNFVTYEIAEKLREIGYDGECMACYANMPNPTLVLIDQSGNTFRTITNSTAIRVAPLWQQAIDWLREKHELRVDVIEDGKEWSGAVWDGRQTYWSEIKPTNSGSFFEARESAILKALELISKN